jgi:hypothetical protein
VARRLAVDKPIDRLRERHARADEDREHDAEAGDPFTPCAAQEEGDAERHSRQRVPEVVDQVGEEGDAPAQGVDRHLQAGRDE